MAVFDVQSLLNQVWDSIKQLRQDVAQLQQTEVPYATSGLAANRPASGTRVGQRYFSTDTGVYRKTFNEMQEQVRTLSNRVVTLEQFILKHSMELPA
jgi:hypothetical protein